jgi:hypothetical protein
LAEALERLTQQIGASAKLHAQRVLNYIEG